MERQHLIGEIVCGVVYGAVIIFAWIFQMKISVNECIILSITYSILFVNNTIFDVWVLKYKRPTVRTIGLVILVCFYVYLAFK